MVCKLGLIVVLMVATQAAVLPNNQLNFLERKRDAVVGQDNLSLEEDALLTVPELITKYEYPVETHQVTTEDGYILTLHRIPHGKDDVPSENRPVVFLQHGLFCSSADWIITGPTHALAYILADMGYDVWMGNARGTRYSRTHTYMNPGSDSDYWRFSWHQIGIRDLPAMIDYTLEHTKQESLFYAGHSQGTTAFYVMCSERPDYNAKIKAHFSLAPIAFMNHMSSPFLQIIAKAQAVADPIADLIGMNEFLPNSELMALAGATFCSDDDLTQVLCSSALFVVCGFNKAQLNATMLPVILGHTPAGMATDQIVHYGQEINSGHFRQWDYGMLGNLEHYGSIFSPDYDLTKVTAPVYLIYSHNDWLAAEVDVLKLYTKLGNAKGKFLVADSKWNHLDYLYGIDAPTLVYNKLITLMETEK